MKRRRIVRRVLLGVAAVLVLAILGFVIWAESPMRAEAGPLAAAREAVTITEVAEGVVLTPDQPDGTGLVFIAGARVEPLAYTATLSGIAEAGVTVVIVKPVLNFAILEFRGLDSFTSLAPAVDEWYVGGHSLGGVRACQYVEADPDAVAGLVLFGSYCAADLSGTDEPVLSLAGGRDGLSTPAKIEAAAHLLPADAEFVELAGASHAQFGAYGDQPGDGSPSATDAEVRLWITDALEGFLIRS